ncbi:MAG: hypothetical protein MUE85_01145 [Microscillaceae bacterium]|jgi:hypothetical protein|nr:hypothetical protein [Microscillaceae bacterium]
MSLELLDKFPPRNDKDLFDTLQFVKKSPFAKDYWKVFKSLYKRSEVALMQAEYPELNDVLINLLGNLIYRLDQVKIQEITSEYPTHATLRYMKRRARRLLRKLGDISPEVYFKLASKTIVANENAQSLDLDNQWVSLDIIYGNSRRFYQKSHGHGAYVLDKSKLQNHHQEERFPAVWDEQSKFLQDILIKDMPWQIHEFAVKVLKRNNLPLPEVSEEVLQKFFNSTSTVLRSVAVTSVYQKFTYQNPKAGLYAGMWLYASAGLRQKIQEIESKRPKPAKVWQDEFAENLAKLTFKELTAGNSSKRILKSVEYLQTNFGKAIPTDNLLPMAEALFHSPYKSLQELAFLGAEKATKDQAMQWLVALDNGKVALKMPMYDRLASILFPKFKGNMQRDEIEPYVFHQAMAVCDFGWRLSAKVQYEYQLYYLWNKLSRYEYRRKFEKPFLNAITSMAGADAFIRYYQKNQYYLNYYSDAALGFLMDNALERVKNFVIRQFVSNLSSQPIYNLSKISKFSLEIKNQILEEALPNIQNRVVFDYSWYVENAFRNANTDEWIASAILKIMGACRIDVNSASNILNTALRYVGGTMGDKVMQWLAQLSEKRQEPFVQALANNYSLVKEFAAKFPKTMILQAIRNQSLDSLLEMTGSVSDENWAMVSEVVYEQLLAKSNEIGFWKSILELVINSPDSQLGARLIQDAKFFALFQQQKDLSILDISQPEFEDFLLSWLEANPQYFAMGSGELFKVCIHKLPKLRHWGLNFARSTGISLPFGLQLFESDLPDAVAEAKHYFNALPAKSNRELEAVLAMCDSPNRTVRDFGLEYAALRKENFPDNEQILEFLSEHADKFVQQFVSEEIAKHKVKKPFVQRFDKEILRMKNRSRKAKENVKERIEQTLNVELSTLLELAQTGTKLDREWAIEQLTKKALAGEEIAGFVLN